MSTATKVEAALPVSYSFAGRFEAVSAARRITGQERTYSGLFDLHDTLDPARPVFDRKEDNTDNTPNAIYRTDLRPILSRCLVQLDDLIKPHTVGFFFERDEPLLTTLSNRAVWAGAAPDKMRAAVEENLATAKYWNTADTVPSLLINNTNAVVVPVGTTPVQYLKHLIDDLIPQVAATQQLAKDHLALVLVQWPIAATGSTV